jgi:hypothetical protein
MLPVTENFATVPQGFVFCITAFHNKNFVTVNAAIAFFGNKNNPATQMC